ncbi:MAG: 2Fe-2S iron-sulfur cluster-binding protein [Chloroflexi bacterium]|nr:2Fe-2S iron-sulfur cluster-binding protein [Chloroflexota bacterium]
MEITLTIDNQTLSIPSEITILEAGILAGIPIPTICFHHATSSNAICRICVVEIEGQKLLQPACIVKGLEGMKVQTKSERVVRARRTILEMLSSSVDLSDSPEILELMKEYGASENRFPDAIRREASVLDDNPMFIRDYSKCILCWRCVQVCGDDAQYVNALNFNGRGYETQIATFYNAPLLSTSCVFCGQCVGVCPSGAIKPKREYLMEQGFLPDQISAMYENRIKRSKNKNKL